jgi:Ca2+-binding EF-hand superfamily protein
MTKSARCIIFICWSFIDLPTFIECKRFTFCSLSLSHFYFFAHFDEYFCTWRCFVVDLLLTFTWLHTKHTRKERKKLQVLICFILRIHAHVSSSSLTARNMPKKQRKNNDLTPKGTSKYIDRSRHIDHLSYLECDILTANANFTEQGSHIHRNRFILSIVVIICLLPIEIQQWHTVKASSYVGNEQTNNWLTIGHALVQTFLRDYPSGQLDKQTFLDYYRQFHPQDESNIAWDRHCSNTMRAMLQWDFPRELFDRIDVNDDGTIDFNELLVLIAIRSRLGNLQSRLAFVFDLFVLFYSNVFDSNDRPCSFYSDGTIQKTVKLIVKN